MTVHVFFKDFSRAYAKISDRLLLAFGATGALIYKKEFAEICVVICYSIGKMSDNIQKKSACFIIGIMMCAFLFSVFGKTLGEKWVVYENGKFNYQIKVPSDFRIIDLTGKGPRFSEKEQHFIHFVGENSRRISLHTRDLYSNDEFINNTYDKKEFLEYLEIAGKNAPAIVYPQGICSKNSCSDPFVFIKVDNSKMSYIINFSHTKELTSEQREILRSISFL